MSVSLDTLSAFVKCKVSKRRFDHTLRVVDMVKYLQSRLKCDSLTLTQAAILHDVAKEMSPVDPFFASAHPKNRFQDIWDAFPGVWHSFSARTLITHSFPELDASVSNIIETHTTGKEGMTMEQKILYVADAVEPGRNYEERLALAEEALVDINRVVFKISSWTINHLLVHRQSIHPHTILCYNHYQSFSN